MRNTLKKNAAAALFFASFTFLQFVILRMGNQAGRGFLTDDRQEKVYVFLQIFVIGGAALHAVLHPALKKSRALPILSGAVLAVLAVCAGIMLFAPVDTAFYLAITVPAAICLGFTAGRVYLEMASLRTPGIRVGLCMGAGYSAALLLQFLLQLQWLIKPAIAVFALGAFAVLAVFLLQKDPAGKAAAEEAAPVRPGKILSACVIASSLLLFQAFYNGYIHHLQIASGYTSFNVYTWPRLLMIPGMLFFGLTGDHKKGRYLPLATLCFSVVAFLNVVLAGNSDKYLLNMCLFYVSLSAAVSYYNLTFWKLARRTGQPALWAVAGRVLDSLFAIPFCLVSLTEASAGVVLSLDIVALAVIIVVMAVNGDFDLSPRQAPAAAPGAMTEDDALSSVAERYKLTPAETRVFRCLVLTEDKQAAIAEKLSVKLRTVQAAVTSIYRKTGVTTRSGLLQIYHDVQK